MEISYRTLEPLHGILARYAAERAEHPRAVIRRMLPGTDGLTFSVVMPRYLGILAENLQKHLPVGINLSADTLAARHTFFPVAATFLEEEERQDLLARIIDGRHVAPYPICHAPRPGSKRQTIRWCPKCALVDRSSVVPVASWRMPHQFFGVHACYIHGCRLIDTECGFGDPQILYDAEQVIPADIPAPVAADAMDVLLAKDLAYLFDAKCPRPGRRRIAAVFESEVRRGNYVIGPSGLLAPAALLKDFSEKFGAAWLDTRGVDRPTGTNEWPRNCMSHDPHFHPPFFLALLGRNFDIPMPELLKEALSANPAKKFVKTCAIVRHSMRVVANAKAAFLEYRKAHPDASRSELRCKIQYVCAVLAQGASDWLESQMPPRKKKTKGVAHDWAARDRELSMRVKAAAESLRKDKGRPNRITGRVLRQRVDGMRWSAAIWKERLPLFQGALSAEADSDLTYGQRRAKWFAGEIAARRARASGVAVFLHDATLIHVAKKEPRLRVFIEDLLKSPVKRALN